MAPLKKEKIFSLFMRFQIIFAFAFSSKEGTRCPLNWSVRSLKERASSIRYALTFSQPLPTSIFFFRPISARQVTAAQTLWREEREEEGGKGLPGKQSELAVPDPVTYFSEHHVTAKPSPALRQRAIASYLISTSKAGWRSWGGGGGESELDGMWSSLTSVWPQKPFQTRHGRKFPAWSHRQSCQLGLQNPTLSVWICCKKWRTAFFLPPSVKFTCTQYSLS